MAKDILEGYVSRRHTFEGVDLTIGVNGKSLVIVLHAITKEFVLKGVVYVPGIVIEKSMVRGSQLTLPIHPISASPIYKPLRCPEAIFRQGVQFVYDFCEVDDDMLLLAEGGILMMSRPPRTGDEVFWKQNPENREDNSRGPFPPEE
jgi:hypothetical protein